MSQLRALTLVSVASLSFAAVSAQPCFALIETAKTSVTVQSLSGTVDAQNTLGVVNSLSQTQQNVEFSIEGIQNNFTLTGGMILAQPDYSGYIVTLRSSAEVPLSTQTDVRQELSSTAHLRWDSGTQSAAIGWMGSMTPSPFYQQNVDLGYTKTFFNKTTAVGVKLAFGTLDQPVDFYSDLNFVTHQRPTLIHTNSASLFADQVLTERYRIEGEVGTGDREEDRPRNLGGSFRQSYALTDRLMTRLDLTRVSELHSQPLLNERGYFSLNAAELFITAEPWIDFLVSASYGYVIEDESDPRSGREVQIGSDQYGLGASYRYHSLSYQTKLGHRISNTGIHDNFVEGGLAWQI
jgi:hypothetical protein